jgi:hypothetical protein
LTSFLALYRGESIAVAKIVAVTAESELVREFAARMLAESELEPDFVLRELENGRRRALELVRGEDSE